MSHPDESMVIASPPSPIVSEPVVVRVPLILFEPRVPPETVSASAMYESPIVVDAETTPELLRARTPPVVPKVRLVRYAFCAVRAVVEAFVEEANVVLRFVAVRPVVDAYAIVPDAAVMLFWKYPSPATVSMRDGVDEEMPTKPLLKMVKSDDDAEFTKFVRRVVDDESLPHTVSLALSVDVPIEVFPDDVAFT